MERTLEDLAREAMELAPESRAALAKRLLDSLELPESLEHQKLWVEESARRYADLRADRSNAVSSEEVFAKLGAR